MKKLVKKVINSCIEAVIFSLLGLGVLIAKGVMILLSVLFYVNDYAEDWANLKAETSKDIMESPGIEEFAEWGPFFKFAVDVVLWVLK